MPLKEGGADVKGCRYCGRSPRTVESETQTDISHFQRNSVVTQTVCSVGPQGPQLDFKYPIVRLVRADINLQPSSVKASRWNKDHSKTKKKETQRSDEYWLKKYGIFKRTCTVVLNRLDIRRARTERLDIGGARTERFGIGGARTERLGIGGARTERQVVEKEVSAEVTKVATSATGEHFTKESVHFEELPQNMQPPELGKKRLIIENKFTESNSLSFLKKQKQNSVTLFEKQTPTIHPHRSVSKMKDLSKGSGIQMNILPLPNHAVSEINRSQTENQWKGSTVQVQDDSIMSATNAIPFNPVSDMETGPLDHQHLDSAIRRAEEEGQENELILGDLPTLIKEEMDPQIQLGGEPLAEIFDPVIQLDEPGEDVWSWSSKDDGSWSSKDDGSWSAGEKRRRSSKDHCRRKRKHWMNESNMVMLNGRPLSSVARDIMHRQMEEIGP